MELNRIMKHNNWVVETGIATGNALANSAPGMGLGWQKQLAGTREAQRKLYRTYTDKYAEFEGQAFYWEQTFENCIEGVGCENSGASIADIFDQWLQMNTPRLVPPTD